MHDIYDYGDGRTRTSAHKDHMQISPDLKLLELTSIEVLSVSLVSLVLVGQVGHDAGFSSDGHNFTIHRFHAANRSPQEPHAVAGLAGSHQLRHGATLPEECLVTLSIVAAKGAYSRIRLENVDQRGKGVQSLVQISTVGGRHLVIPTS
jgi:hypothetical protein